MRLTDPVRRLVLALALGAALLIATAAGAPGRALAEDDVQCGDLITHSVVLAHDITGCLGRDLTGTGDVMDPGNTYVADNTVSGNAWDGIEGKSPTSGDTGNVHYKDNEADDNGRLGINAGANSVDEGGNTAQCVGIVCNASAGPVADLGVQISDNAPADGVNVGDTVLDELHVTNGGPDTATNTVVHVVVPAGMRFDSALSSAGCSVDSPQPTDLPPGATAVSCALGDVGTSGATASVELTATAVGEQTTAAVAVSDVPDSDSSNQGDDDTVTVAPQTRITADQVRPDGRAPDLARFEFSSSEDGARFECAVVGQGTQPAAGDWSQCTSPFAAPHAPDGAGETFLVRAVGGGQTDGSPARRDFTVDAAAPHVGLDRVPSPDRDAAPTFSGAAGTAPGDLHQITVRLYQGAVATGDPYRTLTTTADGGSWSVPAGAPLPDGTYAAVADQSDDVGNTGHSDPPEVFTVDTTPPALRVTEGPDGTIATDHATVSFAYEDGAAVECSLDGEPLRPCSHLDAAHATGEDDLAGLADGDHTWTVRATDAAGNPAAVELDFRVAVPPPDTDAPHVTMDPVASPTNDATPALSGSYGTAPGDTTAVHVDVYAGDDASGTPVAADVPATLDTTAHTWHATPSNGLRPDGVYTAAVRQSDDTGHTGTATRTFRLDTTRPALNVTSGPGHDHPSRMAGFEFTFEPGATAQCRIDFESFRACFRVDAAHGTGLDLASGLGDGPHTWTVRAADAAGNEVQVHWRFTVAIPAPPPPPPPPARPVNLTKPSVSGPSSPHPGQRFLGHGGTWSGTDVRLTYTWLRCDDGDNRIADCRVARTGRAYHIRSADASIVHPQRMLLKVTATNGGGSTDAYAPSFTGVMLPDFTGVITSIGEAIKASLDQMKEILDAAGQALPHTMSIYAVGQRGAELCQYTVLGSPHTDWSCPGGHATAAVASVHHRRHHRRITVLASGTHRFKTTGAEKMRIRLTGAARRTLKARRHAHRVRVTTAVVYRPRHGKAKVRVKHSRVRIPRARRGGGG